MVEIQDFRGRENTDYETRKAKGRGFVDSALRAPTYDRGQQKNRCPPPQVSAHKLHRLTLRMDNALRAPAL
ncbi:hypothetical protein MRX58_12810 (plasmid) [Xylella fastidiosa subsp. pauca]|uniref:hypothetical protein n=1 Tax=Xylella fastidiosa TaxID=2371 RepID=UPI00241D8CD4|nr:hypothetical protein [Xylella fastidiosa]MDG5824392.1 hypothetical protein [Xylella fastidiosa subsp. pauca]MDG5827015.1 hypothetical protein [Xylella fastidiosa subsp. pauca]